MSNGIATLVATALAGGNQPDESRANDLLIPEILLFVLATMAVIARLCVRLRLKPKLWLDDYTMFAAYAWTLFGFVTIIKQVHYGLGQHSINIGEEDVILTMKWNQMARLTFIPCVALIKVSICFFLLRILDERTHPRFRLYIWIVMAASVVSNIVLLVFWSIQCIPLDRTWDPRIEGNCLAPSVVVDVAYVQAGFNLVTDILCALFPMFFFNTAYMRWRTKGALVMLAVLGLLTSVTALLRVVYLQELEQTVDTTWQLTNVTICALIETKAGIFLSCLPAIKCLWTKFLDLLPTRLTGTRTSAKTWDLMESPILPAMDSSSFMSRNEFDKLDALPLRPLAVSRLSTMESGLSKSLDTPPGTPGFAPGEEAGVRVTSFI